MVRHQIDEISVCCEGTGEIMETYSVDYEGYNFKHRTPYDKYSMSCKKDVEKYFKDDLENPSIKVRWTNRAVDELIKADFKTAVYFKHLSKHIISRNIVFEKSSDLCDIIGVHLSDLSKSLRSMSERGLLREFKGHSGKRGMRYLEVNPTIVFKTYQQQGSECNYSSTSRFNRLHQEYVDMWVADAVFLNTSRDI